MKRAEHQPTSDIAIYAGIYCKTYRVPDAGTVLPQHAHDFPHLTLVIAGTVCVHSENRCLGEFTAPMTIRIAARMLHTFTTLTPDCVLVCIHNADHIDADGEPTVFADLKHPELED